MRPKSRYGCARNPDTGCARSPDSCGRITQLIHRACGRIWSHEDELAAIIALEREPIAGERLAGDNPPDVEREVGEAGETRALGVEMLEFKPPAIPLTAGVLARDAVEPALNAA